MAALPEYRPAHPAPLVDLREVHAAYLDGLLAEENAEWLLNLDWDFEPSANLVRRFLGMRGLTGFALPSPRVGRTSTLSATPPIGYAYYVADEGKGLVGGMYITPLHRTRENEDKLLRAVLDALWQTPGLYRVEAQLMLLADPFERTVPYASRFRRYARQFLEVPLSQIVTLPPRDPALAVMPWTENRRAEASRLIAEAYAGHIDSQINDQYQSPAGARRFLTNIVEYPGCGAFFPQGSFVALEPGARKSSGGQALAGMSLASIVAPGSGHITQVCVTPRHRGSGLGYELLRRSMVTLAAHGCNKVSLTVTNENAGAANLYRRMGFRNRRDFAAYVWELR